MNKIYVKFVTFPAPTALLFYLGDELRVAAVFIRYIAQ